MRCEPDLEILPLPGRNFTNVREKAIPSELRVKRAPLIEAEIQVPGDKSISHRAVMFASLSNGVCVLNDFSPGEDCGKSVEAMRTLGVQIDRPDPEGTTLIVHGRYRQLSAPPKPIDCGNSGTTMRLLAGLLAGQPFRSRLTGDASLSGRPMNRIITPLAEMGARTGCDPRRRARSRASPSHRPRGRADRDRRSLTALITSSSSSGDRPTITATPKR